MLILETSMTGYERDYCGNILIYLGFIYLLSVLVNASSAGGQVREQAYCSKGNVPDKEL